MPDYKNLDLNPAEEEIDNFLRQQENRLGEIWSSLRVGSTSREIGEVYALNNPQSYVFVYAARAMAAIRGDVPGSAQLVKQCISYLNMLIRRANGIISKESMLLLQSHLKRLREAEESGVFPSRKSEYAGVEPNSREDNAADEAELQEKVLAIMMPFDAVYNGVYFVISEAAKKSGLKPRRVDEIANNEPIIDDIVSLIESAEIVVCDVSGKNPNVFYEAGVARGIDADVIFITQNHHDVPFDIKHLRYIPYINTLADLRVLEQKLIEHIAIIMAKREKQRKQTVKQSQAVAVTSAQNATNGTT